MGNLRINIDEKLIEPVSNGKIGGRRAEEGPCKSLFTVFVIVDSPTILTYFGNGIATYANGTLVPPDTIITENLTFYVEIEGYQAPNAYLNTVLRSVTCELRTPFTYALIDDQVFHRSFNGSLC